MADNRENRRQTRRISSILKTAATSDDSPTQTFSRRSKRISFSHVNNVKEFRADVDNQTIWGDSYEKDHTTKDLSSSGSISQIPTLNSVAPTSTLNSFAPTSTLNPVATAPTIDLFADIDDSSDEMEVTQNHSEHTNHFNQTMIVEETVTTSTTNSKHVDMCVVFGNSNKRKTIETTSVDTVTTDVTKSVKIRKMNDENLEPGMYNTILHHENMQSTSPEPTSLTESHVNPQATQIFYHGNGDFDTSDASLSQSKLSDNSENLYKVGPSNMFDKTTVSTVDVSFDQPSMTSLVSDTSIPTCQKTYIYGRGDIGAEIDQTCTERNPLQENNTAAWNAMDKIDDSVNESIRDRRMDASVPQFTNHLLSRHSLNPDEPAVEDLTMMMDTKFNAEFSDKSDDNAIESRSPGNLYLENNSLPSKHQESVTLGRRKTLNVLSQTGNKENAQLSHRQASLTEQSFRDLSLDATDNVACRDKTNLSTHYPNILYDSTNDKLTRPKFLDYSTVQDPVAATDFSFAGSDPLSSTRFVPSSKFPLNFSNIDANNKVNCSSVTFNDTPTPTTRRLQDLRSAASLQNNTDELCNMEPDQLKNVGEWQMSKEQISEAKKYFLSLSMLPNDMLENTKLELISTSGSESVGDVSKTPEANDATLNASNTKAATDKSMDESSTEITTAVQEKSRCHKCVNCRMSSGETFADVGKEYEKPKLDFSIFDQFKGLPTMKDVIAARKKREADRAKEEALLVDQNVEAPDIRTLLLNKYAEENTVELQPKYVPKPLICRPMLMKINYLMNNKMKNEYAQWKFNDNFFGMGAIAMRYNEIPSIRIHIKFDINAVSKAAELNMALPFNRVFIEQCPTYLNRISTVNLLKHNHAYGLLPMNLLSLISSSENIYSGLDEMEKRFQTVIAKVNEFDAITAEHDTLVRMESDGTCYVEKTLFNIKKLLAQQFLIEFDKLDTIGPDNVHFDPVCETTAAFKAIPHGLPFLRSFLSDPMSYIVPSVADA